MADRELLELAAKAAGMWKEAFSLGDDWAPIWEDEKGLYLAWGLGWWNPLTDDGQALHLAVRLNLLVLPYPDDESVRVTRLDQPDTIVVWGSPPDPSAATRRAIVCAAAEIGRRR